MSKTTLENEIVAAASDKLLANLMVKPPTPLLTMSQGACYCNVSTPAFKRLKVPSISIGTAKRYRLSDIDAVLNRQRVFSN